MNHKSTLIIIFLFAYFHLSIYADDFLILQDDQGGITGINLSTTGNSNNTILVRPVFNTPLPSVLDLETIHNGGCQLFGTGAVLPVGKARLYSGISPRNESIKLALLPSGNGGWVASPQYIKPIGQTQQLVFPKYDHPIRDIEYDSSRRCLLVLLSNGSVAACYPNSNTWINALQLSNDETMDCEIRDDDLYILSKNGNVYINSNFYTNSQQTINQIDNIPRISNGNLLDIELAADRRGFYILDSNGKIHSFSGAKNISEQHISTIDMEILQADEIPVWFPSGWNTGIELNPCTIKIDPQGPAKIVQLWIKNADNMSSFYSEIHYDPLLIDVDPYIEPGSWWKTNMSNATLNSQLPERKGVLIIQGGGWVTPYNGASGSGELLKLKVAALDKIESGSTTIQVKEFSFKDASPLNFESTVETITPLQVQIAPSHPKLSFAWMEGNQPILNNRYHTQPGSIVRADLLVKEGSRIQSIQANIEFSSTHLQYLGMTKGNAWNDTASVKVDFPLPSQTNKVSILQNIKLTAETQSACKDEPGSLFSILFKMKTNLSSQSTGYIRLQSLTCLYDNGEKCLAETGNLELYLSEERQENN